VGGVGVEGWGGVVRGGGEVGSCVGFGRGGVGRGWAVGRSYKNEK